MRKACDSKDWLWEETGRKTNGGGGQRAGKSSKVELEAQLRQIPRVMQYGQATQLSERKAQGGLAHHTAGWDAELGALIGDKILTVKRKEHRWN